MPFEGISRSASTGAHAARTSPAAAACDAALLRHSASPADDRGAAGDQDRLASSGSTDRRCGPSSRTSCLIDRCTARYGSSARARCARRWAGCATSSRLRPTTCSSGAESARRKRTSRSASLAWVAMPRPHPLRSLLILSLAALAFALAQTMLIPALTELAKSLAHRRERRRLDASPRYLLAAAVCTPIFGRLGDMFGKRRLLVVALGALRRRLGRRPRSARASRSSSPAASCRAPAAASSRSASGSSATSSRASGSARASA